MNERQIYNKIKKERRQAPKIVERDYAAICDRIFCMSSMGQFQGFVRVVGYTDKFVRVCNVAHSQEIRSTNMGDVLSTTTFTVDTRKSVAPAFWLCSLEKTDLNPGVRYTLRQSGKPPTHGTLATTFEQQNKIF